MQNENRIKEEKEAEEKHQRIAIEGGRDKPDPALFRINQNLSEINKNMKEIRLLKTNSKKRIGKKSQYRDFKDCYPTDSKTILDQLILRYWHVLQDKSHDP